MFSGGKMTEEEEMRGETDIQSGKHMKPAKNTRRDRTLFAVFEKGLGCWREREKAERGVAATAHAIETHVFKNQNGLVLRVERWKRGSCGGGGQG